MRKPKVRYLQHCIVGVLTLHQHVFWFDVAVCYIFLVHIVQAAKHLIHDFGRIFLREPFHLENAVVELAAVHEFRYDVVVAVIFEYLVHFHQVRVVRLHQDAQLLHLQLHEDLVLLNPDLLDDLDGSFLV